MTVLAQRIRPTATRLAAALLTALLGASVIVAVAAQEAEAASSFDAGNIIDDSVFFDSGSMTVSQIQSFLDSKGGDLADYVASTTSKPNDAYCDGYSAKSGQTAAQIIKGVADSCDISPRVLLVTLQKETSLVTRTGTSAWYYKRAMGYGCPDSNLGTSVDADQDGCYDWAQGFFQQVYHMAKQFQLYAKKPDSYSYKAGQSNKIKYSPYCSSYSWVYIENQATAGLYNYTPYQPNSAVLNGTSGSCKAYGNYNFWKLFTSWFGTTHGKSIDADLLEAWRDAGGIDGVGLPLAKAVHASSGTYQKFKKYYLFIDNDGDVVKLKKNGALTKAYFAARGPQGLWGWPQTGATYKSGVSWVTFSSRIAYACKGYKQIYSSTREVALSVVPAWFAVGGSDVTGRAVADAVTVGGRTYQKFKKGIVYRDGDASVLLPSSSAITQAYLSAGGPTGSWGWPRSAPKLRNGVSSARFSALYAFSYDGMVGTASRGMSSSVVPAWLKAGGSKVLGNPQGSPSKNDGTIMMRFENGHLYVFSSGKYLYQPYSSALTQAYLDAGGRQGKWGWPLSARSTTKITRIKFEKLNGYEYDGEASTSTGVVRWRLIPAWFEVGGSGKTGNAVAKAHKTSEGMYQEFAKGYVYRSSHGDAAYLPKSGAITKAYLAAGGVDGSWGWPLTSPKKVNGVMTVKFSNGTARIRGGKVVFK
ncbi:LGFP repeat-containing protein [Demequina salsinemoris]|uniref:LGFP repeat-containing protein n=1 Tax=Demequina salsinemoris TaxID=577470 RepID=UPI0007826CD0|nr:hypothetical protein [Demequina salsinemoris]